MPSDNVDPARTRGWYVVLTWVAAALPFAFLCGVTAHYYFRYPFSDEWSFIPLLNKAFLGTLTWHDYWAPYHGHRLFFPRLIMIPLAKATHWNPAVMVVLNVVCGVALFGCVVWVFRRVCRLVGRPFPYLALPVLSLLVFSLNQWCNWAWGWQLLVYMSVLASVLCLASVSVPRLNPLAFAVALALGGVASFSFATGLLCWPAGLGVLLMPRLWGERIRWAYVGAWVAVTAAVFAAFLVGFTHPAYHHSGTFMPQNPLVLFAYVPIYVGANITFFRPWAALPVGVAGIVFAVWGHVLLIRRRVPWPAVAPFTAMILFVLGSAALTGLGRSAQYGASQAAVARYCTISEFFWVGVVGLVFLLAWSAKERDGGSPRRRYITWGVLVVIAGLSILSGRQGFYSLDEHYKVYMPEARRLVVQKLDEVPPRLNPTNNSLKRELAILKKWKLSLFRPEAQAFWRDEGKMGR